MEYLKIQNLYKTDETIAEEIFAGKTYPWEVLPLIGEYIIRLGKLLPADRFEQRGENVWVAKSAKV